MDRQRIRFQDAPWAGTKYNITVGGVGGIGSWLSLFLARIGHNLVLHDFDEVDTSNLGGQLYALNHVGAAKTESIRQTIQTYSGDNRVIDLGEFKEDSTPEPITFACFDSIRARKMMFEAWEEKYINQTPETVGVPTIFIDGRMTAESFQIYCVRPTEEDAARYKETFFEDSEVADLPCSFKATSHIGANISSVMVQVFNNFLTNYGEGFDLRDVPFKIYYESPFLVTQIEY